MSNIPRMGQLPTPVSWTICNYLHYGYGSISHVKMSDLSVPFHQHLWKEDNTLDWKLLSPEPPCSYGFQPVDPSIFWQLTCPSILKVVDYIILSYYISMIASWHPPSDSSDPRLRQVTSPFSTADLQVPLVATEKWLRERDLGWEKRGFSRDFVGI